MRSSMVRKYPNKRFPFPGSPSALASGHTVERPRVYEATPVPRSDLVPRHTRGTKDCDWQEDVPQVTCPGLDVEVGGPAHGPGRVPLGRGGSTRHPRREGRADVGERDGWEREWVGETQEPTGKSRPEPRPRVRTVSYPHHTPPATPSGGHKVPNSTTRRGAR